MIVRAGVLVITDAGNLAAARVGTQRTRGSLGTLGILVAGQLYQRTRNTADPRGTAVAPGPAAARSTRRSPVRSVGFTLAAFSGITGSIAAGASGATLYHGAFGTITACASISCVRGGIAAVSTDIQPKDDTGDEHRRSGKGLVLRRSTVTTGGVGSPARTSCTCAGRAVTAVSGCCRGVSSVATDQIVDGDVRHSLLTAQGPENHARGLLSERTGRTTDSTAAREGPEISGVAGTTHGGRRSRILARATVFAVHRRGRCIAAVTPETGRDAQRALAEVDIHRDTQVEACLEGHATRATTLPGDGRCVCTGYGTVVRGISTATTVGQRDIPVRLHAQAASHPQEPRTSVPPPASLDRAAIPRLGLAWLGILEYPFHLGFRARATASSTRLLGTTCPQNGFAEDPGSRVHPGRRVQVDVAAQVPQGPQWRAVLSENQVDETRGAGLATGCENQRAYMGPG